MRNELRNSPGFSDAEWQQAARYALDNKHPVEGLQWAERSVNPAGGIGRKNFTNLMTLADAQEANGKTADAAKSRDEAMNDPIRHRLRSARLRPPAHRQREERRKR